MASRTFSIYRRIACLVTNAGLPAQMGRHPKEASLGIIRDAALVFSRSQGVIWIGKDKQLPREFQKTKLRFDCRGLIAYPGFVDCHTHPAFGGDRTHEFSLRMTGASYAEIAAAGGGILSTVQHTRALNLKSLTTLIEERFAIAQGFGVRLLEAKSGYGLSETAEIMGLRAIAAAAATANRLKVVPTCLAAHAIPPEFKDDRSAWIKLVCERILPRVARERLAEFVDVFCDQGFYTVNETKSILFAAQSCGLKARLHGDELANTEAADLAVNLSAYSVDHCLKVSDAGIRSLSQSRTVAVLLPATALFLREPPAPARKLIDRGAIVALATDFNPGTSPTQNLPFVASLGAIQLGMSVPEIIAAITWNAALALNKEKEFGCLLPGFKGEPVFIRGEDPAAICYHLAPPHLEEPTRI